MPAPYVVAIDPGHGGSPSSDPAVLWDPGVVAGSLMEKDITLDLAFRLRGLLEQERVKVVMTRTSDRYLEISERWALVHRSGARLFVSLHVNAFEGDPSIQGFTVFYPRADSQSLAAHLESGLAAALQPFGVPDDGVAVKPDLWVHSNVPTATVEPAYLTNAREAGLLRRADFRDAIASGIHQGLLETIRRSRPPINRCGRRNAPRQPGARQTRRPRRRPPLAFDSGSSQGSDWRPWA